MLLKMCSDVDMAPKLRGKCMMSVGALSKVLRLARVPQQQHQLGGHLQKMSGERARALRLGLELQADNLLWSEPYW